MLQPVNFLPWRQRRRHACARFWCVMFSASTLIALTVMVIGYANQDVNEQTNTALLQGEQQFATTLTAARPRLEARQQKRQLAIQHDRRREQTRRWQSALDRLALSLPEQVWLTQIDYRQNTLQLTGSALTFTALGALETALRGSQVFRINHTGATQQDEQGYWQFQYQLTWRDGHDASF